MPESRAQSAPEIRIEIREYIGEQMAAHERLLAEYRASQREASQLAMAAVYDRLGKLNELREEVVKDRLQFVQVAAYSVQHKVIEQKVKKLERWQSWMIGAGAMLAIFGTIAGAVITHLIETRGH